jgi:uncharacterized protein YggE
MKNTAFIFFCLVLNLTFSQQMNSIKNEFSVTGEAIVRVQPNQVILQLGVENRGKDLLETKSKNATIISKAIAYCKSKGIADKHIQTDYVRMTPTYNYNNQSDLNYYTVDQSLSITMENLDQYEEVLTELLKIGINKVEGVSFNNTNLKENRTTARKLAIKAAKEKALFLASEVGIQLGEITNISEYSQNLGTGFLNRSLSQNIVQNMGRDSEVAGLSIGMIPVQASITLTYSIK